MKKRALVAVPLLVLVTLVAWLVRPRHEVIGQAFVSERTVTLWNSRAQVRQPVATLRFGDKLDVLSRRGEQTRVRTALGATGWVDGRLLMEPGLWLRSMQLMEKARTLPVQARGRTKVLSNLRVEPGRSEPRLYQFNRGAPVEVLSRAVADWTPSGDEKDSAGGQEEPKKEDWLLVRGIANRGAGENGPGEPEAASGDTGDQSMPIAGWVMARFVELDLPEAIREGSNATGVRVLAWFELNRVASPSGEKPQYLAVGTRGGDGQPCDFTTLRVYTWGAKHNRYETAYIESNLCGKLPIRAGKSLAGDAEFRLSEMGTAGAERVYRMRQTMVRRVREPGEQKVRATRQAPAR